MNLVRYANEYWVPLKEYADTRDIQGKGNKPYKSRPSLKTAIRNKITGQLKHYYLKFDTSEQVQEVIRENRNNDSFHGFDPRTTSLGLINMKAIDKLEEWFPCRTDSHIVREWEKLQLDYKNKLYKDSKAPKESTQDLISHRSAIIHGLQQDYWEVDRQIQAMQARQERIKASLDQMKSIDFGFVEDEEEISHVEPDKDTKKSQGSSLVLA